MSDEHEHDADAAEAVVETKSRISVVWIIPIVAVLMAAFLGYRAIMDRGPTIRIHFATGEGLAAGKTTVRFKDIEVGKVSGITLSSDLSGVVVEAEMNPGAEKYLTDTTRFWVVRATITAGQVSGLGTLFSGAYIGIDPSADGKRAREFVGLEVAPVVTRDEPGEHYTLRSRHLGSFNVGAPVYFRSVRVGQVVAYELDESGDHVTVEVFVSAPHHKRVRRNTRFWDASGLDVSFGAGGLKLDSPSLIAMVIGGVAFDTPPGIDIDEEPEEGQAFRLFANQQAAREKHYTIARRYLMYFDGSVQGLDTGAPVMFRGIKLGEVLDVKLRYNPITNEFLIPVLIELQPERIAVPGGYVPNDPESRPLVDLVRKGLRGQLALANLLTGQLQVELDIFEDVEPADVDFSGEYPAIPTVATPLDKLASGRRRCRRCARRSSPPTR
jgi:paraquat-inducible protein B